jgi:hypothetical protein
MSILGTTPYDMNIRTGICKQVERRQGHTGRSSGNRPRTIVFVEKRSSFVNVKERFSWLDGADALNNSDASGQKFKLI